MDDLGILAVEEAEYKELVAVKTAVCDLLAEWLDDALGDEEGDLSFVAADGEVGDGPSRLLLCLELPTREVVDDHRHEAVLYDRLNLLLVPRRDVRQEPHRLLQQQQFSSVESVEGVGLRTLFVGNKQDRD